MTNEVLESVRNGLAPVHMSRSLEAMEARGRAHRRTRRLTGLAGVTLIGLAVTLILPATDPDPQRDDMAGRPAASAPYSVQRIERASFTVSRSADDTVTVTFNKAAPEPNALEQALAEVGITARVRVNERCVGAPVPEQFYRVEEPGGEPGWPGNIIKADYVGTWPDGNWVSSFNGANMPTNSTLELGLITDDRNELWEIQVTMSVTGSPFTCRPVVR